MLFGRQVDRTSQVIHLAVHDQSVIRVGMPHLDRLHLVDLLVVFDFCAEHLQVHLHLRDVDKHILKVAVYHLQKVIQSLL